MAEGGEFSICLLDFHIFQGKRWQSQPPPEDKVDACPADGVQPSSLLTNIQPYSNVLQSNNRSSSPSCNSHAREVLDPCSQTYRARYIDQLSAVYTQRPLDKELFSLLFASQLRIRVGQEPGGITWFRKN